MHAMDIEPALAVDCASVEGAAMDHAVINVDAGVGVNLEHPSRPQRLSTVSSYTVLIIESSNVG